VFNPVVDLSQQDVLDRDLPAGFVEIVIARVDKLIDARGVGPGDPRAAQFVGGRVQRQGERDRQFDLVSQSADRRRPGRTVRRPESRR